MSTMLSMESECYVNKVLNIWCNIGVWKIIAIETFIAMLACILSDIYFGMFWLGITFGIIAITSAVIGANRGYFEIDNFVNVYMFEKTSEEEAEFIKRCKSSNLYMTSNLVKYKHLFVG